MKSIFTILWDFEKLIYKVLMWFILIPKTIVKITLQPGWAHDYIANELELAHKDDKDDPKAPFDEYISPVLLLLVVALIPALIFNFLPAFGSIITSPAEDKPTTDRFLTFESTTDFKSSSTAMAYFHVWRVEKVQPDGSYVEVYRENHYPGSATNFIEIIDGKTVKDRFLYTFPDLASGDYYVDVYAAKYNPAREDAPVVELYPSSLKVTVPFKLDEHIIILSDKSRSAAATAADIGIENIVAQFQKENTIFLALALMIPPLLFALATRLLLEPVGEYALKKNFYVQCYYFSPLSLAVWATYYARYFFTDDAYFYITPKAIESILLAPPILAGLWFFRTEVKTMSIERNVTGIRPFLIVLTCAAVLGVAIYVFFNFQDFQDRIRLLSIQAYPVLSATLATIFGIAWYRRRRAEGKGITLRNLSWVAVSIVVLIGAMQFVSFTSVTIPDAPLVSVATAGSGGAGSSSGEQTQSVELPASLPTQTAVVYAPVFASTSTPTFFQPVESPVALDTPFPATGQPATTLIPDTPTLAFQPFYTEEFNADIPGWIRFMTSGDERMVSMRVALGKLSIDLLQLEDKLPWFYLINNDYTYADVKVDAVVTNRGVNANGISLICRYSDIGWYEFQVSYSGFYTIYAVDSVGIVNQGYNKLIEGGSTLINSNLSTNVLTAECKGSELSLYVNQTLVQSIPETSFNFSQGKIGIAVSSPEKFPINVDFETLTVSEP